MIGDNHVRFGGRWGVVRRPRPSLLFFMVEKLKIFNFKPLVSSYSTYSTTGGGQDNLFRREDKENIGNTSDDNNNILIVGNYNGNNNGQL